MRTGWLTDVEGNLLCPKGLDASEEPHDEENQASRVALEFKNVERWKHQDSEMDPNDPRNVQILGGSLKQFGQNQLNDFQSGLRDDEFCDWSVIQNSNRLRLLFLRDQEVQEFKNLRMIPSTEAEIISDVFQVTPFVAANCETHFNDFLFLFFILMNF